jgi:hypothetical protein
MGTGEVMLLEHLRQTGRTFPWLYKRARMEPLQVACNWQCVSLRSFEVAVGQCS